ncbi:hypothetical protein, partial [Nocardioides sp.]|uniref:hypothetical protein n=1 Tax=Nocardioides sp. TaxID=35761 RepID=UPI002B265679
MKPPESLLPRRPRWRGVGALGLAAALLSATTACLPDQIDGRQEGSDARPIVDLSWWEETTAADAVDAALVAMAEIGSVRLTQDAESPLPGEVADGDGSVRVVSKDLLIAAGDGLGDAAAGDCTGTLQLPGWSAPAELVVQAGLGAFRGDADFWVGFGDNYPKVPDAGEQLAEQYADAWTTTPGLASLCELSDFLGPVSTMVGDDDVVKAGLGDVAGVTAGRLVATGKKRTVTPWVQVAEPHLVLRVAIEQRSSVGESAERTVTTFSEFDSTVGVDFPRTGSILAFEAPSDAPGSEPSPTPSPA